MKPILCIVLCLVLVSCVSAPAAVPTAIQSPTAVPSTAITQAASAVPSPAPTKQPMAMPSPTTAEPPTSAPSPTAEPTVPPGGQSMGIGLDPFVAAWNSGDPDSIRGLYAENAMIYSEAAMLALRNKEETEASVAGESFAALVEEHSGQTLAILGEPIIVFDKLVAFVYRWERGSEGANGAALLRYEGDRILLHAFMEESQSAPNLADPVAYLSDVSFDGLMQAWSSSKLEQAQPFYSESPVIVSDEDLLVARWRDFLHPVGLERVLGQFRGWNPTATGPATQVGPFAVGAWGWQMFEYPIGQGIRLVHYQDGLIVTDVRFAIRPWEATGATFLND